MIVVADTSPVSNLLVIGKIELLHQLFAEILIPPKVHQEIIALERFGFNTSVVQSSKWIKVESPANTRLVNRLAMSLDLGEAQAIALAANTTNCLLLIDEKKGRKAAEDLGIDYIGIIGILLKAKAEGFLYQVKPVLDKLVQDAGFWLATGLYTRILIEAGEN